MPVPIACTLTPVGARDQLAEWQALLSPASTCVTVDGSRLTVDLDPARLDAAALVDLARREQACCAFLAFSLEIRATSVRLVIDAPPDAEPIVRGFADLARP